MAYAQHRLIALCCEHGRARLRMRERAERQRGDELLRGRGHGHANLMSLLAPVGGEMAGLECGDAAGHAEKNMRHSRYCPSLDVGKTYENCVKYISNRLRHAALRHCRQMNPAGMADCRIRLW